MYVHTYTTAKEISVTECTIGTHKVDFHRHVHMIVYVRMYVHPNTSTYIRTYVHISTVFQQIKRDCLFFTAALSHPQAHTVCGHDKALALLVCALFESHKQQKHPNKTLTCECMYIRIQRQKKFQSQNALLVLTRLTSTGTFTWSYTYVCMYIQTQVRTYVRTYVMLMWWVQKYNVIFTTITFQISKPTTIQYHMRSPHHAQRGWK
jgi:hypothetical protein